MLESVTESFDEQLPKIREYPKIQSPNFRITKAQQLRQAFDVRNFVDDAELDKKIEQLRKDALLFRELPPSEKLVNDFNKIIYGEKGRHRDAVTALKAQQNMLLLKEMQSEQKALIRNVKNLKTQIDPALAWFSSAWA